MYTYYEALGWSGSAGGYAGIQAHPKGHNYIFSIWDHKTHTAPIKAVYRGAGTKTEKFGGEGTGLKSWNFELGWETDVWYTLVARCWPVGDHTFFGYWVRSDKTDLWTHMVTMNVAAKEAYFNGGNDSFIEDWLETGNNARTIHLRNGWKRSPDGRWHAFGSARYSVNSWDLTEGKRSFNYRDNWNGGVGKDQSGKYYFMTSGGKGTKPTTTNPSKHTIIRKKKTPDYATIRIQSGKVYTSKNESLTVTWTIDPKTTPQFAYSITAHKNLAGQGEPVFEIEKIEPHKRSIEIPIPTDLELAGLHWQLRCRDIIGNQSEPFQLQKSK